MPQIKVIQQVIQTASNVTGATNGSPISLDGALTYAAQVVADVNTPTNKTFASTAVNVTTEVITLTTHGYSTGLKVQISNPGTLPTGISPTTDYFVIALTANTFQLASSLANALAGTPIDITAQGSGTNTVEVTAIAGASVKLQMSNDDPNSPPVNWYDEGSASNVTVDAVLPLKKVNPEGNWMRVVYTLTAGQFSASTTIVVKGPN